MEVQCTEYSMQAGQNCTILEKLGLIVNVFLKKQVIFPLLPFFTFLFFAYILGETYLSISLRSFIIDVYACKINDLNICQNRSSKQTPKDPSVCVL